MARPRTRPRYASLNKGKIRAGPTLVEKGEKELGKISKVIRYHKDEIIFEQDELARDLYIIQKGDVIIYRTYLNHKVELARLSEGEVFGEFSFFDGAPRSATAIALNDVEVLKIIGKGGEGLVKELPDWMMPVLRCIFSRFRELDEKTAALMAANDVSQKHFGIKNIVERMFRELHRLLKLTIVVQDEKENDMSKGEFVKEFESLVGTTPLNLNVFWSQFNRHSLIHPDASEENFVIREDLIKELLTHLNEQVSKKKFSHLSSKAWGILRQLISGQEGESSNANNPNDRVSKPYKDLEKELSLHKKSDIMELAEADIISRTGTNFSWSYHYIFLSYIIQTFLSAFKVSYKAV